MEHQARSEELPEILKRNKKWPLHLITGRDGSYEEITKTLVDEGFWYRPETSNHNSMTDHGDSKYWGLRNGFVLVIVSY